ncbi:MAG: alpha/beta hydrolase [Acidobacteria bacterium]|nr:alpha/beta hydrolase [Acidobacteriota bacterium]
MVKASDSYESSPFVQDNHTLTGNFRRHSNFHSNFLDQNRDVIVYLPPNYEASESYKVSQSHEDATRRFPVLYLNDGQNLFDATTAFNGVEWGVDETAQRLILSGRIEPLIIVGVYNTGADRIDEYTPTVDSRQKRGGKAGQYGRFLTEELKPFIDHRYRTLTGPEFTGLGGSSLGGLLTLYLGLKYPNVFSRLMVMSPSVWWDHWWILKFVQHLRAKPTTRIWLDIGTKEGKFTPGVVRQLRDLLLMQGWRLDADLKFMEIRGGQHTEAAWAKRVEPALRFLFPKQRRK